MRGYAFAIISLAGNCLMLLLRLVAHGLEKLFEKSLKLLHKLRFFKDLHGVL